MKLKLKDKQRSIIANFGDGRLGNQLSNFATNYAILKDYGMYPYINSMQHNILKAVFSLPKLNDMDNASYYIWDTGIA